jgi:hypothetical protein
MTPLTSVPSDASRNKFTNLPFLTSAITFSPVLSAVFLRACRRRTLVFEFSRKSTSRFRGLRCLVRALVVTPNRPLSPMNNGEHRCQFQITESDFICFSL